MQRFFVDPAILEQPEVILRGDIAHQISRVLRMRPGDEVLLLDGRGNEYPIRLTGIERDVVKGSVLEKRGGESGEPAVVVDLYLSLLNKPDKFEWALQKCTELGVNAILPVLAERCVPGGQESAGKYTRWERIVKEAAEQSGRSRVPLIAPTANLTKAVENAGAESAKYEDCPAVISVLGAERSLRDVLRAGRFRQLSIFVGPEGGFTDAEVAAAREAGVVPVSLGPRTLRAETAAVAALAMVMYELGEMDAQATAQE